MRLLSYRDLKDWGIPYSKSQLRRLEKAGKFPQRRVFSSQRHAWVEQEIQAYLDEIATRRRGYGGATNSVRFGGAE
jgi:prophage regulatory protein